MTPTFIGIYEDLAPQEYCESMIKKLDQLLMDGSQSDFGKNAYNGVKNRNDVARYFHNDAIDLSVQTHGILDVALRKYADEYPSIEMHDVYSNTCKVQKTPKKGGFHRWHSEQSTSDGMQARALTWLIYLNDTPDGEGETELLEYGVKVQPKAGTVLIFPAGWTHTHRGNPVYSCDKYIATGWYYLVN